MRMREIPAGRVPSPASDPDGRLTVDGEAFAGSVLIAGGAVHAWGPDSAATITPASLRSVLEADPSVDLLLLGTGNHREPIPEAAAQHLEQAGVAVEIMATAAALRAWRALLGDARVTAMGLIPPRAAG